MRLDSLRFLSVREPHVTRISEGLKTIELRTWPIATGLLGIASTAENGRPGEKRCVVDVIECRLATIEDAEAACASVDDMAAWLDDCHARNVPPVAVVLSPTVRRVVREPVRGRLGLWRAPVTFAVGEELEELECGFCSLNFSAPINALAIECPGCQEELELREE